MDAGITIIGAGVVGLAIAAEIGGENVCVLEKNRKFGMETSSRNSEVIHASLYYREMRCFMKSARKKALAAKSSANLSWLQTSKKSAH